MASISMFTPTAYNERRQQNNPNYNPQYGYGSAPFGSNTMDTQSQFTQSPVMPDSLYRSAPTSAPVIKQPTPQGFLDAYNATSDAQAQAHIDHADSEEEAKRIQQQNEHQKSLMASGIAQGKSPEEIQNSHSIFQNAGFLRGVLGSSLALLSGANPYEVFQAGQEGYNQGSVSDSIEKNIDQMRQQYTPESIQVAYETGNMGALTPRTYTLEEQEAKQQAAHEQGRAEQQADESRRWQHEADVKSSDRAYNEQLAKQQAEQWNVDSKGHAWRINPKTQKPEFDNSAVAGLSNQSAAEELGIKTGRSGNAQEISVVTKRLALPISKVQAAQTTLNAFEGWDQKTDNQKLAAVKSGGDGLVRSILGGNAMLTPEYIQKIAGRDSYAGQILDTLYKKGVGSVSDAEMQYIVDLAHTSQEDSKKIIRGIMSNNRDAYMSKNPGLSNVQVQQNLETVYGVQPGDYMTDSEQEYASSHAGAWYRGYKNKQGAMTPSNNNQSGSSGQQSASQISKTDEDALMRLRNKTGLNKGAK